MMDEEFITLSFGEKSSTAWVKIHKHVTKMLGNARRHLEGPISEEETQRTRGKIDAFKSLLALEDEEDAPSR